MKKFYSVSYQVTYTADVEADNPAEAAAMVAAYCPYDIDSPAIVWRSRNDKPDDIIYWDENEISLPTFDDEERGEEE